MTLPPVTLQRNPSHRKSRLTASILDEIANYLITQIVPANINGGTFNPRWKRLAFFAPGIFMVSRCGHEKRFPDVPSKPRLLPWLKSVAHLLSDPAYYIGWYWDHDADELVFDISCPCVGQHAAMQVAIVCQQSEIYDVATGKLIKVDRAAWFKAHTFQIGVAA